MADGGCAGASDAQARDWPRLTLSETSDFSRPFDWESREMDDQSMQVLTLVALADDVSGGSGSLDRISASLSGLPRVNRSAGLVAERGAVAHAARLPPRVDTVDDPPKLALWAAARSC